MVTCMMSASIFEDRRSKLCMHDQAMIITLKNFSFRRSYSRGHRAVLSDPEPRPREILEFFLSQRMWRLRWFTCLTEGTHEPNLSSVYHNYTVKFLLGQPKEWSGPAQGRGDLRIQCLSGVKETQQGLKWGPKI